MRADGSNSPGNKEPGKCHYNVRHPVSANGQGWYRDRPIIHIQRIRQALMSERHSGNNAAKACSKGAVPTGRNMWYRQSRNLLNSLVEKIARPGKADTKGERGTASPFRQSEKSAPGIRQLVSWADMYDNCTFEAKKMIVAQFVKSVSVKRITRLTLL